MENGSLSVASERKEGGSFRMKQETTDLMVKAERAIHSAEIP